MPRMNVTLMPKILVCMIAVTISLESVSCGQQLKVRTERAPFYVGEAIAIEVDAIDFDAEPKIEVNGADQASVNLAFRNTGRSESTRIFQSGGKLVRSRVVKTTYYYQVSFEAPGEFTIGPFSASYQGKEITHPAVTFAVKDIEVTNDMRVEIKVPSGNLYPGQQVPVKLRWMYAGDTRLVQGLTIRTELFDRFRFADLKADRRANAIPITTAKGIQNFPATFERETIDGKQFLVATVERMLIADKPEKVELPPTFVSFQKVVGTRRSNDVFDSFFDVQPETKPIKGIGYPVKFEVKPFPEENRPESFQGAVGEEYRLTASLNRTDVRTGDPLTLQINILGQGNLESVGIPDLKEHFSREDFDWPDGDAAGVVTDGQKQFRVSMRVKNESVKEIPRIEFSWFNPKTEEYQTTYSPPIAVDVSKGSVVSSEDVISLSENRASRDENNSDPVLNRLDLSIETDIQKLLLQPKPLIEAWLIYALGVVTIGVALVANRAKSKRDTGQSHAKLIQICCQEIRNLPENEKLLATLASKLRELQKLIGQSDQHDTEGVSSELDQLVSDCEALLFRPGKESQDESRKLLDRTLHWLANR